MPGSEKKCKNSEYRNTAEGFWVISQSVPTLYSDDVTSQHMTFIDGIQSRFRGGTDQCPARNWRTLSDLALFRAGSERLDIWRGAFSAPLQI